MKRRTRKILIGLSVPVVLAGIGLVAVAGSMLDFSLQSESLSRSRDTEFLIGELHESYPFMSEWLDSMQENHLLKDTFLISKADGSRLHALYATAAEPTHRTAILVHGYCDSSLRMLMLGYMYHHDLNYNILLMDNHAHGQSEGKAIQMGWLDRLDVLQWIDLAHRRFSTPEKEAIMVVHGISMGAATTMCVAGEVEGHGPAAELDCVREILPMPYVKCFVEDCGYTSVWDEFSYNIRDMFGLPSWPLLNIASRICEWKYGWNFREASPLDQVRLCSLPMLFIHGEADEFVPTEMVYPLYAAKPEPKEFWLTQSEGHAHSYRDNPDEYTRRVAVFTGTFMR